MALDLTRLESEVTEITDASDAAVALIAGLAQMVRDTKGDPAAVTSLADRLDAAGQRLAAAVVAGTEPPVVP